jgi:hypothetical protein
MQGAAHRDVRAHHPHASAFPSTTVIASRHSTLEMCRDVLKGVPLILKYVARAAAHATAPLYGCTPLQATQIDQWLDFADRTFVSGPALEASVTAASDALALRTFMAGHSLSIADICAWGALMSAPMWGKVKRLPAARNLLRWFDFVAAQPPLVATVARLNPRAAQAAATSASRVRCAVLLFACLQICDYAGCALVATVARRNPRAGRRRGRFAGALCRLACWSGFLAVL